MHRASPAWQGNYHRQHLTHMHESCSYMHMRTTINIEERLIEEAKRLTGLREKTAVVHAGLEALIARESAKRLAALGGTERTIRKVSRRRARAAR